MDSEELRFPNLSLWKGALKFDLKYWSDLIFVFPILFVPVWTDCYHSVLVRQAIDNEGKIDAEDAIFETMRLFPSFVSTKFKLYLVAYLWAYVPIIGWYKDYRYRLKWAMASNVHVFEIDVEESILRRCNELADLVIQKKCSNALWLIPYLLFFGVLVAGLVALTALHSSVVFWICAVFGGWIVFPGSALVNTLVYLRITENPASESVGR